MLVLGINDGFDAGAALVRDSKVLAAVNEERLSRIKFHEGAYYGFPVRSIREVFRIAAVSPEAVDRVAVATVIPVSPVHRWLGYRRTFARVTRAPSSLAASAGWGASIKCIVSDWISDRKAASIVGRLSTGVTRQVYRRFLPRMGLRCPFYVVDHHLAHAASAYYTSGWDDSLVVTLDGHGDGLSGSVCIGRGGLLDRRTEVPSRDSAGWFYSGITRFLGFKVHRHEGKITGLAAFGDPGVCHSRLAPLLAYENGSLRNRLGSPYDERRVRRRLAPVASVPREHVAAAAQKILDDAVTGWLSDILREHGGGEARIAAAGGVFANVKTNQRISDLEGVRELFIHPHMGDGGTALGAAFLVLEDLSREQGRELRPVRVDHVYWGPSYTDAEIEAELAKHGLKARYVEDIEGEVARLVARKQAVGLFQGAMEYGPRALGNRSIIAEPGDKSINDTLNQRLKRTEFMPFAPSSMEEHSDELYRGWGKRAFSTKFMTITLDCTPLCAQIAPAVVHVDNTARPQSVSPRENPRYHRILSIYRELTGLPIFLNTSFNMHEEPIVCTPDDAIRSYEAGAVDYLALGNYLVVPRGGRGP